MCQLMKVHSVGMSIACVRICIYGHFVFHMVDHLKISVCALFQSQMRFKNRMQLRTNTHNLARTHIHVHCTHELYKKNIRSTRYIKFSSVISHLINATVQVFSTLLLPLWLGLFTCWLSFQRKWKCRRNQLATFRLFLLL